MPRPVRKSPPIQFRLELDEYEYADKRAAKHDESPSQWAGRNMSRLIRAEMEKERAANAARSRAATRRAHLVPVPNGDAPAHEEAPI